MKSDQDMDIDIEKHGDSDASKLEEAKAKDEEEDAGVGRSYECSFCKRGFTNAQALGGHMNIHRKDKAKAKARQKNQQQHHETSNKSKDNPRFMQQQVSSSTDHHHYQMNYQVYLPSANPSSQTRSHYSPHPRPEESDLWLRMGASPPAAGGGSNVEETEVDLELRLGHDK